MQTCLLYTSPAILASSLPQLLAMFRLPGSSFSGRFVSAEANYAPLRAGKQVIPYWDSDCLFERGRDQAGAYRCLLSAPLAAVSYTHLDVYKRQTLPISIMNVMDGMRGNQEMIVSGESNVDETATAPLDLSLIHI